MMVLRRLGYLSVNRVVFGKAISADLAKLSEIHSWWISNNKTKFMMPNKNFQLFGFYFNSAMLS